MTNNGDERAKLAEQVDGLLKIELDRSGAESS